MKLLFFGLLLALAVCNNTNCFDYVYKERLHTGWNITTTTCVAEETEIDKAGVIKSCCDCEGVIEFSSNKDHALKLDYPVEFIFDIYAEEEMTLAVQIRDDDNNWSKKVVIQDFSCNKWDTVKLNYTLFETKNNNIDAVRFRREDEREKYANDFYLANIRFRINEDEYLESGAVKIGASLVALAIALIALFI